MPAAHRRRAAPRLLAGLLAATLLASCTNATPVDFPAGTTMHRLQRAGTITVGVKFDQPGLGFRNLATGRLEGFDIEIAKLIAAGLGLRPNQIRYLEAPSRDREQLLSTGRVDIVIASYTITFVRQRQVGQAGPYFLTGQQVLVRADDRTTITGPDHLRGRRVCSASGSTSYRRLIKLGATPVSATYYTECVQQLLGRTVDAVTTDGVILSVYAAQQPDKLAVVGPEFSFEQYGIGYRKNDHAFCQYLVRTMQEIRDSGAWERAFDDTLGQAGVPPIPAPAPRPCMTDS